MLRLAQRHACTADRAPSIGRRALPVTVLLAGVAALATAAAPDAGESTSADASPASAVVYPESRETLEPTIRRDPLAFLQRARTWAKGHIHEYTGHFQKLERVDGHLQKPEKMQMKFRREPFSVYLKWVAEPSKGQEAIYVQGKYKGHVQVHPSGLLGVIFRRVSIDPIGKTARKHSRRPVTMAGMVNMIGLVTGQCEEAHARGDLTLTYEGVRVEGGRPAYVLKRVLPDGKGYPCELLVIFIDTEYLVCFRTDAYNWDGELISHYFYTNLDMAPGLTDRDFDPDNPDYGYRLF